MQLEKFPDPSQYNMSVKGGLNSLLCIKREQNKHRKGKNYFGYSLRVANPVSILEGGHASGSVQFLSGGTTAEIYQFVGGVACANPP